MGPLTIIKHTILVVHSKVRFWNNEYWFWFPTYPSYLLHLLIIPQP